MADHGPIHRLGCPSSGAARRCASGRHRPPPRASSP